ncbi:MAG TPA: CU044_5270 family protein [Acidimicrobiales bacterium]|nr:CU044_5270 family protein [Acidimicrobiales bacterium]
MYVDDLVRDADPVRVPGRHPALGATWNRQFDDIASGRRRTRRRRRRAARAGMAGAAAAVVAVVVAVAVAAPWSSAPPSSAGVLDDAAAAVESAPVPVLGAGQYRYTATSGLDQVTLYAPVGTTGGRTTYRSVAEATYTELDQVWVDRTGAGRVVTTVGPLRFPSAADQAAWEASPAALQWALLTTAHPVTTTTDVQQVATDVSALPTDPVVLGQLLASGDTGTAVDDVPSGPDSTFKRAAHLLTGPTVGMTPALESALYRVMAAQPGTTVATAVTGRSGVQGTAVSVSAQGIDRVIVDPRSGAPLEADFAPSSAVVAVDDGGHPATVCSATAPCTTQGPARGLVRQSVAWSAPAAPVVVGSDTSTVPVAP